MSNEKIAKRLSEEAKILLMQASRLEKIACLFPKEIELFKADIKRLKIEIKRLKSQIKHLEKTQRRFGESWWD